MRQSVAPLFPESPALDKPLRRYRSLMTADVNDKGVLDIDTVKGCTAGMRVYEIITTD